MEEVLSSGGSGSFGYELHVVVEGGNEFPRIPDKNVFCRCQSLGSVQVSKPCPLRGPDVPIHADFVWKFTAKEWNSMRKSKEPLKIQVVISNSKDAIPTSNTEVVSKKLLGFVLIDLRHVSAEEEGKYMTLQSSQHQRYNLKTPFQIFVSSFVQGMDDRSKIVDESDVVEESKVVKQQHRYRFSIDLHSVRDLIVSSARVYVEYEYPPFGSHPIVRSNPAVEVGRHEEVSLPNGFCAFEFVASENLLYKALATQPLVVRVMHKDMYTKDVELGLATLRLSNVLVSPKMKNEGFRVQTTEELVSVCTFEGDSVVKKVAGLRVVLGLEDFGIEEEFEPVDDQSNRMSREEPRKNIPERTPQPQKKNMEENNVMDDISRSSLEVIEPKEKESVKKKKDIREPIPSSTPQRRREMPQEQKTVEEHGDSIQNESNEKVPEENLVARAEKLVRDTPEYRTALELELWKRDEQKRFEEHMKEMETRKMDAIEKEIRKMEEQHGKKLQEKQKELIDVEEKLRIAVINTEKREAKLVHVEQEMRRRRDEMEKEHKRKIAEVEDTVRRAKEEGEHRLALERMKSTSLLKEKQHFENRLADKEKQYEDLLQKYSDLKTSQSSTPEVVLQAKIVELTNSNRELEKLVDQHKQSKLRYKKELRKAMAELQSLREQHQRDMRSEWEKGKGESVAKMEDVHHEEPKRETEPAKVIGAEYLRSFVDDVRKTSATEQEELDNLKRDLKMRMTSEVIATDHEKSIVRDSNLRGGGLTAEMDRLRREREDLLATGVYSMDDLVVRHINRRIEQLLHEYHKK